MGISSPTNISGSSDEPKSELKLFPALRWFSKGMLNCIIMGLLMIPILLYLTAFIDSNSNLQKGMNMERGFSNKVDLATGSVGRSIAVDMASKVAEIVRVA
jgi:hypothetical protein